MSHKDLMNFQGMVYLGQQLSALKPEGELYKITACLDPKYAKIIGVLTAIQKLPNISEKTKKMANDIIPFMETLGIATWPRSEFTNLALRVSNRHIGHISLAKTEESKDENIDLSDTIQEGDNEPTELE